MATPSLTSSIHHLGARFAVELPAFRGPLDLLLHLIEREELEISAVSLMSVTHSYLQALEALEEIDPGALAEFLMVASRLLLIKSRSLLPQPRPPLEEDEEDSADALVRQLLEYRQFQQIAAALRQREQAGLRVFIRTAPEPEIERRLDMGNVTIDKLHAALQRVLRRMPNATPLPRVRTYPITIAEQISLVRGRLHSAARLNNGTASLRFVDLLGEARSRMEVVVTFLAILELIKQHEVDVMQDNTFGEIHLSLSQP
jgi:segregation and condensation protein A